VDFLGLLQKKLSLLLWYMTYNEKFWLANDAIINWDLVDPLTRSLSFTK